MILNQKFRFRYKNFDTVDITKIVLLMKKHFDKKTPNLLLMIKKHLE